MLIKTATNKHTEVYLLGVVILYCGIIALQ